MKIRSRLVVLVLSVLLPAFAAGAVAVWFVYSKQMRAQEESLVEASRVLSQLIDNELESSEQFLHALAASPELAAGNLERFYQHIKALSDSGEKVLILSTPEGRQVLNTRLPFDIPSYRINPDLLELRGAAGPNRTIVSDLYLSTVGKRHDVAVQVPVVIDGSVRYYLARAIEASALQHFLTAQGFPSNWIASITDRRGVVIARSINSEQFVGKSATGTLAQKISQKIPHGINEGVTLEGKPVKAFFHRAPKSEWTIILSVPAAELMRPAVYASVLLAGLMLLILFGALLLTRRYVTRTLLPIQRLRDDAYRLGRGEPVAPYSSGLIELDAVSAALAHASVQIRDAKTDLERKVAEAIDSTERAQRALLQSQKLEALGRLTGGVAHDFNNVLQTLTSSLQLIRLESRPEKIPQRIATCEKAVARATSLVAQMRAFGRSQDACRETLLADQAVGAVLPMLESGLPTTIGLLTRIEPGIWPVTVDRTQFELALLNLVMNARDAITQNGAIEITVSNHEQVTATEHLQAGQYVKIAVADNGTGMPPEVLSRAFDPFFTTKSVDKGSGLGLPQAYGFATQSQGTLALDSVVGSGTTATLYLPRALGDRRANALPVPDRCSAPGPITLNGTVLFVEDDQLVRDSVAPMLEQAGATVLCASSGEEALSVLGTASDIDVLFSDIVMPGRMNGLHLAKHVRTRYPNIAIVLATGYFDESIDLPGVRLLTKPYQADEAIELIAQAMSPVPAAVERSA